MIDFLKFNYNYLAHSKTNFNLEDRFKIIFESFKVNSIFELENEINEFLNQIGGKYWLTENYAFVGGIDYSDRKEENEYYKTTGFIH